MIEQSLTTPEKPELEKWHTISEPDILDKLDTSVDGLTSPQAAQRLEQYGLNKLDEAPPITIWAMLWEQFNDFVIWLLIGAALISAFLGEYVETAAILAIVVLNAVLGIVQERKASEALAALKQLAAPDAHVMRDGHRI
ncbi:MAG: cation-transporting P-type ATPase, partial [Chloroflexota bacterium]